MKRKLLIVVYWFLVVILSTIIITLCRGLSRYYLDTDLGALSMVGLMALIIYGARFGYRKFFGSEMFRHRKSGSHFTQITSESSRTPRVTAFWVVAGVLGAICILILLSTSSDKTSDGVKERPSVAGKKPAQKSDKKTSVTVSREPARGLTEADLKDPRTVQSTKEVLLKKWKSRIKSYLRSRDKLEQYDLNKFPKAIAWSYTHDDQTIVLVRWGTDIVHVKAAIGIQGNTLVKITAFKKGPGSIPHTYGPLGKKIESAL